MGALDAAPGFLVRQAAQPAVVGRGSHGGARRLAQRRVQRLADVVDVDVLVPRQQARGGEQGLRGLLFTQVADHHGAQASRGLGQRLARRGRLIDHAALGAQPGVERGRPRLLQYHERARQLQRALRRRIDGDVAVEVGAGQHHGEAAFWMPAGPGGNGIRRAPRVQGDHRRIVAGQGRRPLPDDAHGVAVPEVALPALRRLPVAVVGVAQGRRDDHQLRHTARFSHGVRSEHESRSGKYRARRRP